MSGNVHAAMHAEHKQWANEAALWRDDVGVWLEEIRSALADLGRLEAILRQHEKALKSHAAAVRLHEQGQKRHEHLLAEHERGGTEEQLVALSKAHLQEAARQAEQRGAHERVKKHQHTVMARWALLLRALGEAM
jgi:hypothetical protein